MSIMMLVVHLVLRREASILVLLDWQLVNILSIDLRLGVRRLEYGTADIAIGLVGSFVLLLLDHEHRHATNHD